MLAMLLISKSSPIFIKRGFLFIHPFIGINARLQSDKNVASANSWF
jgi:hypothetical protein